MKKREYSDREIERLLTSIGDEWREGLIEPVRPAEAERFVAALESRLVQEQRTDKPSPIEEIAAALRVAVAQLRSCGTLPLSWIEGLKPLGLGAADLASAFAFDERREEETLSESVPSFDKRLYCGLEVAADGQTTIRFETADEELAGAHVDYSIVGPEDTEPVAIGRVTLVALGEEKLRWGAQTSLAKTARIGAEHQLVFAVTSTG